MNDDDNWDYACHECGSMRCGCTNRAARTRISEEMLQKQGSFVRVVGLQPVFKDTATVRTTSMFNCKLCGKDLGREFIKFGRGSHFNCKLSVKHSLDALGQGLRDAGMLQHAWEVGTEYGYSNLWAPGCGLGFVRDWNPNVRYDHDAGDEDSV